MITPEQQKLKDVIDFLETLGSKEEEDLSSDMDQHPIEYARLLIAMGALSTKASGNLNKNYETVTVLEFAAKYDKEKYEVSHVKHSLGVDILIKNKETCEEHSVEVKHSLTTKSTGYKTNWNFTVDAKLHLRCKREPTAQHISLLMNDIYRKQKNGFSYLVSRTGKDFLASYEVSGAFMTLYCVKKLITATCSVVNLGCQRCATCNQYHRLVHIQQWGVELEKRITASKQPFQYRLTYFTPLEWIQITKIIKSKC